MTTAQPNTMSGCLWIRYSLFIVLYPTGVFCELMSIWMTRECALTAMTTAQPNTMSGWILQTLKFSFGSLGIMENTTRYYGVILLAYLFGLPPLYMSLLGARRNQLSKPKTASVNGAKKTQ